MSSKRKIATIITVCAITLICACALSTIIYKRIKYDASFYSQANNYIKYDFLQDNKVRSYYKNENYVEGVDAWTDEYIYCDDAPSTRTFIIDSDEKYSEIFGGEDLKVDFNEKIIILYIFSDISQREYQLKNISCKNGQLNLNIKPKSSNKDDSVMPYGRCFVLQINRMNITKVYFFKQH